MKLNKFKNFAPAFIFGLSVLAGCTQKTDPQPQAQPQVQPQPKTTQSAPENNGQERNRASMLKQQLDYYSQHLEEAKQVWHDCQAKGPDNLNEAQKETCMVAQSVWESQPYKAGNRK